jgi:hypothetical protein
MGGLPGCTDPNTITPMRVHPDDIAHARAATDPVRGRRGSIERAVRLAAVDPATIRARLARRRSAGLLERMARRQTLASPAR